MTKELFGTDGIRGIPGTYPLDAATLYGVARALGKYLLEIDPGPPALLGMGTRESGPHIAPQLAAGLADDGVAFISAGVITTPGVACLVRQKKFSAGMVISASHNPFHDNGVKLFTGTGMKFPDDVEEHLETEIHKHKGRETAPHGVPVPADLSLDEENLAYLGGPPTPARTRHPRSESQGAKIGSGLRQRRCQPARPRVVPIPRRGSNRHTQPAERP